MFDVLGVRGDRCALIVAEGTRSMIRASNASLRALSLATESPNVEALDSKATARPAAPATFSVPDLWERS